jgi:hypothetical protein
LFHHKNDISNSCFANSVYISFSLIFLSLPPLRLSV